MKMQENTKCRGCDEIRLCLNGYCSECYVSTPTDPEPSWDQIMMETSRERVAMANTPSQISVDLAFYERMAAALKDTVAYSEDEKHRLIAMVERAECEIKRRKQQIRERKERDAIKWY